MLRGLQRRTRPTRITSFANYKVFGPRNQYRRFGLLYLRGKPKHVGKRIFLRESFVFCFSDGKRAKLIEYVYVYSRHIQPYTPIPQSSQTYTNLPNHYTDRKEK